MAQAGHRSGTIVDDHLFATKPRKWLPAMAQPRGARG